ncbi:MAG: T9SS type A sorting domain-containing protein [Candidatus Eisenbacteria bacterium]
MRLPSMAPGGVPLTPIDFQGRLVLGSSSGSMGAYGRTRTLGALAWDGANFERLGTKKLDVFQCIRDWNGVLVASRGQSGPAIHEEIFRWNGSEWDSLATANAAVIMVGAHQGGLVAFGNFTVIGGVAANHVAFFDGTAWHPMGAGLSLAGTLSSGTNTPPILSVGGKVYISNSDVWCFNGTSWANITTGVLNGPVRAITTDGTDLYAGGAFTKAGADSLPSVGRWDGSAWHRVGTGGPYFISFNCLAWWQGHLYATIPDGTSAISVFDGLQWHGTGDASSGTVGLWACGSRLVSVGQYRPASGAVADARAYDGVSWTDVADSWGPDMTGVSSYVSAGVVWNDRLIVTGANRTAGAGTGAIRTNNLATWDGASWSGLANGINLQPLALGTLGADLVVGGFFNAPGGGRNIARWNGSAWFGYGNDLPAYAWAFQDYAGDVIVGGDQGVFRYTGATWVPLGGAASIDNVCLALAAHNQQLVAAGQFVSTSNGQPLAHIAAWDGLQWSPLGSGLSGDCNALVAFGGNLIAGGYFTHAGGLPVGGLARWDGTQWSAMGTRSRSVSDFALLDGVLYACGAFEQADGEVTNTVARWTGTDWLPLGSGGNFYWVEGYHGDLYVGGSYAFAFGQVTSNIMRLPAANTLDVAGVPALTKVALTAAPNPVRASSVLSFALPSAGHVRLTVHDVSGREIARVADAEFAAGSHRVSWNAAGVAPGLYFARLTNASGVRTTRLVLIGR